MRFLVLALLSSNSPCNPKQLSHFLGFRLLCLKTEELTKNQGSVMIPKREVRPLQNGGAEERVLNSSWKLGKVSVTPSSPIVLVCVLPSPMPTHTPDLELQHYHTSTSSPRLFLP